MSYRRADTIADAIRLLAASVAVVADPTLLTALKSGPGAYDAMKKLAAKPPPGLARLADDLAGDARALFDATRDLPDDAEVLFEQMVEFGLVAAPEIVAADMDAGAVVEAMLGKLTAPELRSGQMVALFRALTTPALTRLLSDKAFAADLTPAFMQRLLGEATEARAGIEGLSEKLDRIAAQPRDVLEALAARFEIERVYAMKDAELREALEKRAEEYRANRAQIEAIDERTAGLGNLKAAAKDAAERLDFDEVEALLSRVQVVELEVAAETPLLRANNALLRGRVDDAFRLLSAAADSFGGVDATGPARRRMIFADRLYDYGLRYGNTEGLARSERMIRVALEDLSETLAPEAWANAQLRLGDALMEQGSRSDGKAGWTQLSDAIRAYIAALRVYDEGTSPAEWARAQRSIGAALRERSRRLKDGSSSRAGTNMARRYFSAALRVYTESDHPLEWARTQTAIGVAWARSGGRGGGKLAASHHKVALRVLTELAHPEEWARTMHNLGIALALQSLPAESAEAFCAALRVWTEAAHPVDWARTMENLGLAQEALAATGAGEPCKSLREAATSFEAALRVYDPEHMPYDHGTASAALARVRATLARDCA